jgi:hypothetical protein
MLTAFRKSGFVGRYGKRYSNASPMSDGAAYARLAPKQKQLAIGYQLFIWQIRQLSPVATGVNPHRAVGAKGNDLASRQSGDLLNLAILVCF